MSKFKNKYRVESIRLPEYDYSQAGAYFITICTHIKQNFFGEIIDGKMKLSVIGKVVAECWIDIPNHFPHTSLDYFVIMPNHIHGIINIKIDFSIVETYKYTTQNITNPDVETYKYTSQNSTKTETKSNTETKNFSSLQKTKFQSPSKTIGSAIRGFKIGVTKWARQNTEIYQLWQPNYYEHIIRNEKSLSRIREYIQYNPLNWSNDELFNK